MMLNLYCVYDKVAEEYSAPMVAKTDGMAVRIFNQTVKNSENVNLDDLSLYCLGSFDSDLGVILPVPGDKNRLVSLLAPLEAV